MNAVIGMLELAVRRADRGQLDRPSLEVAYHSAKDLLGLIGDIRTSSGSSPAIYAFPGVGRSQRSGRVSGQGIRWPGATERPGPASGHRAKRPLPRAARSTAVQAGAVEPVSNAIKFTDQGQIQINLLVNEDTDRDGPCLELKVRDTGIGIHEEALKELFNPFVQANPHSEGARAGTGLGLAISHSLSEMMGGTLSIKSLPGVGTQVTLVMPCNASKRHR